MIATVRDPNHATSKSLLELPKGDDSKLVIVKIASESETDSQDAVRILQTEHGIQNFDVVVANAGWGTIWDSTLQTKPQEVRDMVNINAIGKRFCCRILKSLEDFSSWSTYLAQAKTDQALKVPSCCGRPLTSC